MHIKKIFASAAAVWLLCISIPPAEAESIRVHVTLCGENGALVMVQEEVAVTDIDSDGVITINDALYAAHEAKYTGGAQAGYAFAQTQYGAGVTKLWGAESGSGYGYYVNNNAAISLTDKISSGDYISAFVYTDTVNFSDTYCYFDVQTLDAEAGEAFTLTLSAASFDENWNPVSVPVKGASILIDGQKSAYVTDENGKAALTLDNAKTYVISASSDTQSLVPPAAVVRIAPTQSASPDTGTDAGGVVFASVLISAAAVTAFAVRRRVQ